jgi:hypothetical protein
LHGINLIKRTGWTSFVANLKKLNRAENVQM